MTDSVRQANRWVILIMGTLLHLCLGTVYAWSYFQNPLVNAYGWTNSQTVWVFSLAICCLGRSAAVGGGVLPRVGPRRLALAGGALFGSGYLLAALALRLKSLPLLYLGYGVVGGTGLGLGYVTPVATVARWFPDRKGLATGAVVMGFGLGALLMSKVLAPALMVWTGDNLVVVFGSLGAVFAALTMAVAAFLRNPPPGYSPAGWVPSGTAASPAAIPEDNEPRECLASGRFALLWLVFFCNIVAGISIISFQSPLLQDIYIRRDSSFTSVPQLRAAEKREKVEGREILTPPERTALKDMTKALAALGGTLIAVSSIFNGVGRFFWGSLSDRIGRAAAFRLMLGTQIAVFGLLLTTGHPWVFGALVCFVLLAYGGGFGTMPAFVLTVFGNRAMAVVYGSLLTAWSAAGVVGPQIIAYIKDHYAARASTYSFATGGTFLLVGFLLSLVLHDRPFTSNTSPPSSSRAR